MQTLGANITPIKQLGPKKNLRVSSDFTKHQQPMENHAFDSVTMPN
jgi:hypothetical protein